ncbi:unnamed protein product [Blepharisma stoltei]|uniref:Uncharacterized protein n=1 Tax=Blepharisma stoltei TaxID=1481888 RepID=A0AAU9K0C9_9CILI|nr:unnamed protein product [Blepharisma stoltei]
MITDPLRTYKNPFHSSAISWINSLLGSISTSKNIAGVLVIVEAALPKLFPAIIATLMPLSWTLRISLSFASWYEGSQSLFSLLKLTQIWIPSISFVPGISECIIPLPAVIHWMPPCDISPILPLKSSCLQLPWSIYVTVSKPLWGWSGKPAGLLTKKWSIIRKGSKFFNWEVPITRFTRAPTPSDNSRGLTILTTDLDIFNLLILR